MLDSFQQKTDLMNTFLFLDLKDWIPAYLS